MDAKVLSFFIDDLIVEKVKVGEIPVDFKDDDGNTLIHYAVITNNANLIRHFYSLGLSVNVQNNEGKLPIHMTTAPEVSLDVVKTLIECGTVDIKDNNGLTAKDYVFLSLKQNGGFQQFLKFFKANYDDEKRSLIDQIPVVDNIPEDKKEREGNGESEENEDIQNQDLVESKERDLEEQEEKEREEEESQESQYENQDQGEQKEQQDSQDRQDENQDENNDLNKESFDYSQEDNQNSNDKEDNGSKSGENDKLSVSNDYNNQREDESSEENNESKNSDEQLDQSDEMDGYQSDQQGDESQEYQEQESLDNSEGNSGLDLDDNSDNIESAESGSAENTEDMENNAKDSSDDTSDSNNDSKSNDADLDLDSNKDNNKLLDEELPLDEELQDCKESIEDELEAREELANESMEEGSDGNSNEEDNNSESIDDEDYSYDEQDDYDYDYVDYIQDEDFDDYDYDDYDYDDERQSNKEFSLSVQETFLKKMELEFVNFISKIAESLSYQQIEGDDYWDSQKLLARKLDKRPLSECMYSIDKERIVLLLDTSGSCVDQSDFYKKVASLSAKLGYVEIYEAPNGIIETIYDPHNEEFIPITEVLSPVIDENRLGDWRDIFYDRVIIFFGDFDGGDSVVHASFSNTVYWFSSENRYSDMDEHSWCSYVLDDFRGIYIPDIFNEVDLIRNLKHIKPKKIKPIEQPKNKEYCELIEEFLNSKRDVSPIHMHKKRRIKSR